jgi:hypothetical protein
LHCGIIYLVHQQSPYVQEDQLGGVKGQAFSKAAAAAAESFNTGKPER